jgi:hypothetical protein
LRDLCFDSSFCILHSSSNHPLRPQLPLAIHAPVAFAPFVLRLSRSSVLGPRHHSIIEGGPSRTRPTAIEEKSRKKKKPTIEVCDHRRAPKQAAATAGLRPPPPTYPPPAISRIHTSLDLTHHHGHGLGSAPAPPRQQTDDNISLWPSGASIIFFVPPIPPFL